MLPETGESNLLKAAATGDSSALSQLLLLHYDELHVHVTQRLAGHEGALWRVEDVLQETFYRAAASAAKFEYRGDRSFVAWLKTISSNLIKDTRKRHRRERRAEPGKSHIGDGSADGLAERLADDSTPPSRQVRRRDSVSRMRAAMADLAPVERAVLERYYLEDQPLDQIASELGRTPDAVRGICYRARRNLRELLGRSSQFLSR